jgi:hypothetical protein
MGLTRDGVALLVAAKRLGANYDKTLMLGRQSLMVDPARMRAAFAENGVRLSRSAARSLVAEGAGYSEPLLRRLGASHVDSLDMSGFEGSTVIHDLNAPLPAELREQFSVVIDGGTLEHIFNYPTALRNALDMVREGGHFIAITPANNYLGHGFYQFSPELFYRVLAPTNGFEMDVMLLKARHWRAPWRHVPDPEARGQRLIWRGAWPSLLYLVAKRTEIRPLLREPVMQSDYISVWEGTERVAPPAPKRRLRRAVLASAQAASAQPGMPLAVKELSESLTTWRTSRSALEAVDLRTVGSNAP